VGEFGPQLIPGAYLVGADPEAALLDHPELRAVLTKALLAAARPEGRGTK
jgi:hypothetical protein